MSSLPIHDIADELVAAFKSHNRLVVSAPTGSGKTTQVPQILYRAGVIEGRILVLQPRRLAARVVAQRVAGEMGSALGGLVGYQTRHDRRVSPATQVRFVTEGLLLRLLCTDPALSGVGAVVLDEFHERSVVCDTALGLLRTLQESCRPDLRVLVMSATLDTELVAQYLSCPVLSAAGRVFPIELRYLASLSDRPTWELAADALATILESNDEGDVLIFMPGAYEIRRTLDACRQAAGSDRVDVHALHGSMPAHEQDAAIRPGKKRKVIVSTNVAETSITIEGIRHVIDSGLVRMHRHDPRRGINVLLVEPISQASAQQRAGRAGRTAPGTCTRLWTRVAHRTRPAQTTPEIQRVDLADVCLVLGSLKVQDPARFPWLEAPPPEALAKASDVLGRLGALDPEGALTATGWKMVSLPVHPRLARLLLAASERACLPRAALWAALINERAILLPGACPSGCEDVVAEGASDLHVLECAFLAAQAAGFDGAWCARHGLHPGACREVQRTQNLFLTASRRAGLSVRDRGDRDTSALRQCVLLGFPDHLAMLRNTSRGICDLVGARRGTLDRTSIVKEPGLLLPVEIREVPKGAGVKTVLSLVSRIEPRWLEEVLPERLDRDVCTVWNGQQKIVQTLERHLFDDLVIDEAPRARVDGDAAAGILSDLVSRGDLKLEGWDEAVDQWIQRTRCVAAWFPQRRLLTYDEGDRRILLLEICGGATRASQVRSAPCLEAVRGALSWDDQQFVQAMAPESIRLPSGRRARVRYRASGPPVVRAFIQDLYGLGDSPRIAGGRQKVVLEILGPNHRPLQVTDDLGNFWKALYPDLKKDLARRYPKHEWR